MSVLLQNREGVSYGHLVTLDLTICCNCGVPFALPQYLNQKLKETGDSFYCPNGHSQHYCKSEVQRLKEELDHKEKSISYLNEIVRDKNVTINIKERQIANAKGQVTKIKNRVKRGMCPVPGCKRHFNNLDEHIKNQHPNYHGDTKMDG